MKRPKLLLPELIELLRNQNFIVKKFSETEPHLHTYFESIEMLALLKKIGKKKRLSSQIYLAILHAQFKDFVQLSSPTQWQLFLLVLLGKVLGFRI